MINSKLIRILTVLSSEELKQLERFIKSVFYNENEHIIQLFLYLRKQHPEWKEEKLERKKVWKKVYGDIPFNEVTCRKLMSNLVQLVEKFVIKGLPAAKQDDIADLYNFYIQRYLTKDAEDSMREWEQEQSLNMIQNADFYLKQIEIAKANMLQPNPSINPKDQHRAKNFLHNSDIQYIITQLQWNAVLMNNSAILYFEYKSPFIPAILAQIEADAVWLEIPAIYIYYHLYKMMEKESEPHFYEKVNEATEKYAAYLSRDEWVYIASFLRNYCIRKVLGGEKLFIPKLHALYIHQLKTNLLFSYNQIVPANFRNIVINALACEQYEWATTFVHTYKENLPEEERDSLVAYCLASIHFAQKNYKNVLVCLNEITKLDNIFRELDVKVLKIKTFYELQEFEPMQSTLDSLKVHISRQGSIAESYKTRYKNFTNFLYRIWHIPVMEQKKWQKLYAELAEMKESDFMQKDWLLEKIAEKKKI